MTNSKKGSETKGKPETLDRSNLDITLASSTQSPGDIYFDDVGVLKWKKELGKFIFEGDEVASAQVFYEAFGHVITDRVREDLKEFYEVGFKDGIAHVSKDIPIREALDKGFKCCIEDNT